MLSDDLNGKGIQNREDICICIADSLCYTAETNTTLKAIILYLNKLKKNKKPGNTVQVFLRSVSPGL